MTGLFLCLQVICGCTMYSQSQTDEARATQDTMHMKRKVNEYDDRIKDNKVLVDRLHNRCDELQQKLEREVRQRDKSISDLKSEVSALRAERKAMLDGMYKNLSTELSAKMATVMKAYASQASVQTSQSGRLHRVEAGQTLSEIARAYKTTVEAIAKANNLKRVNAIREGQELFIPE